MNWLTLGYVIGTTVMFWFLACIWSAKERHNLFLKMVFILNGITGSIIIVNYFATRL